MSSLNKCCFIGNLGKDVEVRSMGNGGKVANFSIACTETWKKDGQKQEKTTWVPIVIFNEHLVRFAENYLHKGDKVYIEGAFQTRKWQDKEGNDRYSTEIVLQKFKGELKPLTPKTSGNRQETRNEPRQDAPKESFEMDESLEIPFS